MSYNFCVIKKEENVYKVVGFTYEMIDAIATIENDGSIKLSGKGAKKYKKEILEDVETYMKEESKTIHYEEQPKESKSDIVLNASGLDLTNITTDEPHATIEMPLTVRIDVNKIQTIEDIKKVLEFLNITVPIYKNDPRYLKAKDLLEVLN